jgi:predicted nucleic acid-binding protein
MTTFVVDASVAIKWVVDEPGTSHALTIRSADRLVAPELWVAECANILWKKVRRGEFTVEQALDAAELLQGAGVEVMVGEPTMTRVVQFATTLDHPAYDCVYLALAAENGWRLVSADDRLLARLRGSSLERHALSIGAAALEIISGVK